MNRLAAILVTLVLAAVGCKKSPPADYSVDGYTFRLPAGWSAELQTLPHAKHVNFSTWDVDAACYAQVFDVELSASEYLDDMATEFKAKERTPKTLQTALGSFEGTAFVGALSTDSLSGKVAKMAGEPHAEIYALRDSGRFVGLVVTTFSRTDNREASYAACTSVLKSIHRNAPKDKSP